MLYLLELVQSDVIACQEHSAPEGRLSLRDRQEIERKLHEAWSAYPQPYGLFYLHLQASYLPRHIASDDPAEPGE